MRAPKPASPSAWTRGPIPRRRATGRPWTPRLWIVAGRTAAARMRPAVIVQALLVVQMTRRAVCGNDLLRPRMQLPCAEVASPKLLAWTGILADATIPDRTTAWGPAEHPSIPQAGIPVRILLVTVRHDPATKLAPSKETDPVEHMAALELLPAHRLSYTYWAQTQLTKLANLKRSVGHHALRNIKIPWGRDLRSLSQNELHEIS